MVNQFSAMILAAGYGKRLLPVTEKIPKPLVKINGITLLDNTIRFLIKLGCNHVVINTHYKAEQINSAINKHKYRKKIEIIYEENILDTGGAIKNASSLFKNPNVLITNGDIFWHDDNLNDIKKIINNFIKDKMPTLLLVEKSKAFGLNSNKGDFVLDRNRIRRYMEGDDIYYYSGLQFVSLDYFTNIKETKFSSNIVWDYLIKENLLTGHLMSSNLFHVGNPQGLSKVKKLIS